ncbi:hypothetical protein GH714_013565 [Hevea brasiliensis]|uniref:GDSL esterase/lipase n=1 Tax=Hevea brasiliensis TaxID=3981 RepID=A0A6A6N1D6_HEVBR|nr:hypothetical protein GH714_013565 [Hevea brasiliensis]
MAAASSSNNINYITAVFGFGDSTIDAGNNNYLATDTRSDHPPYGVDFPFHIPTGRFSNGKLPIDFIVSSLALKESLPPYLDPRLTDEDLLTGASFGSAGSGLDPLTAQSSNVLNISTQLDLFDRALRRIKGLVGDRRASFIVENALFFFSIGSNDLLFNFYDSPARTSEFTISGYQDYLLQNLEAAIQRLYNRGGRRFVVTSLSPIGCLPLEVTLFSNTSQRMCVQQQNNDSIAYNVKLQLLASRLETQVLQGSKVAYYNVYNPMEDFIYNPNKVILLSGFKQTLKGCCGTGLVEVGSTCNVTTPICSDRSEYVFWDAVHPSLKTYRYLAEVAILTVISHVLGH